MIQAVIFDFGNVLAFPPAQQKLDRAAAFCGLPTGDFLEAFWRERLEYDAGKMEPLEYWSGVTNPNFAAANLEELIRIEVDFWNQYDVRPFEWINALRAAGVKIGILSNLPRMLGEALRRETFQGREFLGFFDHITFSYELLSVKPQAPIYHHSFEGLNVDPANALFIDDKLPNIHGAIETGLRAEHYLGWEDFVARDVPRLYGLADAAL